MCMYIYIYICIYIYDDDDEAAQKGALLLFVKGTCGNYTEHARLNESRPRAGGTS